MPQIAVVEIGHAVARVPAAEILPPDRLVIANAAGGHRQPEAPAGSQMHHSIHVWELIMAYEFTQRRDAVVIHHLLGPHIKRWRLRLKKISVRVSHQPRLDHALERCGIGRRSELRQAENGCDHITSVQVVVAPSGEVTTLHHLHQCPLVDEWLE